MKLVVGNQKAYLNRDQVIDFIEKTKNGNCSNAIIGPSFIYIDLYLERSKYILCAQNVSCKGNTTTTGEVSAEQLNSVGVAYTIVGHSERRLDQHETSDMFCQKINNLVNNNIIPIFCVGENHEEKERNVSKDVVAREILEVFEKLDVDVIEKVIIAYEPIWSISNGITPSKIPSNDEIESIVNYIKDLVQEKYGKRLAVLYGGSVNKSNVDTLNEIEVVDGYLIGGASVKPDDFLYIMSKCE